MTDPAEGQATPAVASPGSAPAPLDTTGTPQQVTPEVRPGSEMPSATATPVAEGQPAEQITPRNWEADYKALEAKAKQEREDQVRAWRHQDSLARAATARAEQLAREKAEHLEAIKRQVQERVQRVLTDGRTLLTDDLSVDPQRVASFVNDVVQQSLDRYDQQIQAREQAAQLAAHDRAVAEAWDGASVSLKQWAVIDAGGPKMSDDEWRTWVDRHGRAFSGYGDPMLAVAAAKDQLRGIYFDRFAAKVRQAEQQDAHRKATAALTNAPPGPSGSAAVQPGTQDPAAAYFGTGSPGLRNISSLFRVDRK